VISSSRVSNFNSPKPQNPIFTENMEGVNHSFLDDLRIFMAAVRVRGVGK